MNKHIKLTALFAALVLALAACPTDAGDDDDDDGLPALTGTVSISGDEGIGQTLTADTTALDGDGAISYQWYRGDTPVTGKTEQTYTPDEADRGRPLLVKVRRAGYTGVVASPPTGEIGDYVPGKKTLNVTLNVGNEIFYSLATGLPVDNPASGGWDIGFKSVGTSTISGGRMVLTNSGVTAAQYSTGGQGGIYPTGLTDFAAVTLADKKEGLIDGFDYSPYHTDKKRWVSMMGVTEATLNVTSFMGYTNENDPGAGETQGAPLAPKMVDMTFPGDKFGFWAMPVMGTIVPTGRVYIVKHADGQSHSALQIQAYSFGSTETYTVVIRPLE
jgi:hypothetical protein